MRSRQSGVQKYAWIVFCSAHFLITRCLNRGMIKAENLVYFNRIADPFIIWSHTIRMILVMSIGNH